MKNTKHQTSNTKQISNTKYPTPREGNGDSRAEWRLKDEPTKNEGRGHPFDYEAVRWSLSPHPGPTAVELRVPMKIISFLDVQSKYIGYSKWGCAPSLKAFPSMSLISSRNCGGSSAICSSAGVIAYVRRTSHGSGN